MKKVWDKSDDDFLKENYPREGVKFCEIHLNRKKGSICKRAHKLKEQKLINKIIYNKSNSLFDEIKIDDLSTPTLAEETEYIKKEISRLINVMYGDKKNKLSKGLDHHLIKVI